MVQHIRYSPTFSFRSCRTPCLKHRTSNLYTAILDTLLALMLLC
nr:MAG TPA: hypothetical protein [Caudoviricetes sp.]